MDPLLPLWLVVIASVVAGVFIGVFFERTRGAAAKRAAKFEADLVQVRSELMRYQDQTKQHFGKSAELLGRMATDYREFLDHFVTGAEELCPNMKELNASGLERPLLDGAATAPTVTAAPGTLDAAPQTAAAPATPTNGAPAHAAAPMPPPPLDSEPLAEDVVR